MILKPNVADSGKYTGVTLYPESHHAAVTTLLPINPAVEGRLRFDVCVVGAGYTGLSASLHLAELGYEVALVDAQRIGWGASGRNGGQLGYGMSAMQPDLLRNFGATRAQEFWDMSVESVNLFHSLCTRHAIDCDFRSGNMACATTPAKFDYLCRHADIVNGYGAEIFERHDRETTQHVSGSEIYKGSILAHRAGHINPLKYALGLARAAAQAGVAIFEDSRVTDIRLTEPISVSFASGTIVADFAVLACNGYLGNLNTSMANRILPVDNYQAATEVLDAATAATLVKGGVCIWDTSNSIHYFRISPDNRLIMGCSIGIPGHPPRDLEKDCRKHIAYVYPHLKGVNIDYIWGGTLGATRNRLPDAGRLAPNALYAQGFTGHGVGIAPLVGKYMAQAIHGESHGFEFLAEIEHENLPGGRFLRIPAILAYRFRTNTVDMLTRHLIAD